MHAVKNLFGAYAYAQHYISRRYVCILAAINEATKMQQLSVLRIGSCRCRYINSDAVVLSQRHC